MYTPESAFQDGAAKLLELVGARQARILVNGAPVGPPVRFEFDPDAPDIELFRVRRAPTQLLFDITDVLTAVLAEVTVEQFVKVRTDPSRFDEYDEVERAELEGGDAEEETEEEAETPEDAQAKYELVAKTFPIEDLQRRLWVKTTTTQTLFGSVSWEIVRKLRDESGLPSFEGGQAVGFLRLAGHTPIGSSVTSRLNFF